MKEKLSKLIDKITENKSKVFIAVGAAVLTIAVAVGAFCALHDKPASNDNTSSGLASSASVPSEDIDLQEEPQIPDNEDVDEEVEEKENINVEESQVTDTGFVSSSNHTTTVNNTSSVKDTSNKNSHSSSNGNTKPVTTAKKDYLDVSKLTGTQADVGKVVGYSNLFAADIIVTSVVESKTVDGLKYIETLYSDGSCTTVTECRYCHEFPCSDGGGINCSQYNVQNDSTVTCQQCGKPKGDGHNGTCYRLIDWNNGGKIICNHYD